MDRKQKILQVIIAVLLIFICSVFSFISYHSVKSDKDFKTSYTPTLFLHGSPTTRNSMLPMIKRIESDVQGNNTLVLIVDEDGHVRTQGKYQKVRNPLIQIIFENNDSTEYNQVKWLTKCLEFLYKEYGIKKVNFVGHSLGGVDILLYLAQYEPKVRRKVPQIVKVVTLGAPFNSVRDNLNEDYKKIMRDGPRHTNETFDYIREGMKKHPLNVKDWLNVAGDKYDNGQNDGTVPVGSVVSISKLMRQQHIDYEVKIVPYIRHSGLHESTTVDKLVEKFLWGDQSSMKKNLKKNEKSVK